MKSFPTTLNKGGANLNPQTANSSLKDITVNSFKNAMVGTISKITTGRGLDIEGIRYNEKQEPRDLLENPNFFQQDNKMRYTSTLLSDGTNSSNKLYPIENQFRFGQSVFDTMNYYRGYIPNVASFIGQDDPNDPKAVGFAIFKGLSPSLFNPIYGVNYKGITDNVPLLDRFENPLHSDEVIRRLTDCSIKELVNESEKDFNSSVLGMQKYKYADFMYCKDLGKVSNNHLITLRKYAFPIGDDIIFSEGETKKTKESNDQADIARLVTWFGTEDNKLEDILTYDYEATWKKLDAEIQQLDSQEDDKKKRGVIGLISNLSSGEYLNQVKTGQAGEDLPGIFGKWGASAQYRNNDVVNGRNYDKNKVYEPINTIRSTHIYEGNLKFNHTIKLKFSYKLRAYDQINPKSAFLDLLGNILEMTYRSGNFWGGSRQIIGPTTNRKTWNKVETFFNNAVDGAENLFTDLVNGNFSMDNLLGSLGNMLGNVKDAAKSLTTGDKDLLKKVGKEAIGVISGLIHNKLGRPAVYAFHSMLKDDNVGLWHVTIGNPKNPIACFGNMILTKSTISHSGPLGIDDFPTELSVTVELTHAKPRDSRAIQQMYTRGRRVIYNAFAKDLKTHEYPKLNTDKRGVAGYFGQSGTDSNKRVVKIRDEKL